MKTIVKELNLLDIEDIEEAISKAAGRKISISEIGCTFVYHYDIDAGYTDGMLVLFDFGEDVDDFFGANEIFDCSNDDELYWKGKRLSLNERCLPINEVFNFDPSVFKSFEIEENTDN